MKLLLLGIGIGLGLGFSTAIGGFLDDFPPGGQREQEDNRPRFVNPYGPPTQGSPFAERDARSFKKNPC